MNYIFSDYKNERTLLESSGNEFLNYEDNELNSISPSLIPIKHTDEPFGIETNAVETIQQEETSSFMLAENMNFNIRHSNLNINL